MKLSIHYSNVPTEEKLLKDFKNYVEFDNAIKSVQKVLEAIGDRSVSVQANKETVDGCVNFWISITTVKFCKKFEWRTEGVFYEDPSKENQFKVNATKVTEDHFFTELEGLKV
jgi:hypothetical protein